MVPKTQFRDGRHLSYFTNEIIEETISPWFTVVLSSVKKVRCCLIRVITHMTKAPYILSGECQFFDSVCTNSGRDQIIDHGHGTSEATMISHIQYKVIILCNIFCFRAYWSYRTQRAQWGYRTQRTFRGYRTNWIHWCNRTQRTFWCNRTQRTFWCSRLDIFSLQKDH